jgi:hypothetical protein
METKVLTQEEIDNIKNIKEKNIYLIEQYGLIEYKIQELLVQKEKINNEFKIIKSLELDVAKQLQNKYGDGSIDLEKGEFISYKV